MTSYQENTTKQPIECWILTTDRAKKTHRHTDKHRNGFLKHKRVKHFLSNLNNNANETSASWYDVTHDDDFRRIAVLKGSLNFFFLAFCGVIYQNLLHRRVYIAVSSLKLLFRQFCEKPLHITFNRLHHVFIGGTIWWANIICFKFSNTLIDMCGYCYQKLPKVVQTTCSYTQISIWASLYIMV